MALIVLVLFAMILGSGIRIILVAKEGVDPAHLQRIAGTKSVMIAKIGGWLATIFSATILIWFLVTIAMDP